MKVIVPPIKSQGIKTKLVPWIMELAPKVKGKWIEPFLGTSVVAFNSGYKKAILNDTNPHIINFYKGIQEKSISAPLMKRYLHTGNGNWTIDIKKSGDAYQVIASPNLGINMIFVEGNGVLKYNSLVISMNEQGHILYSDNGEEYVKE